VRVPIFSQRLDIFEQLLQTLVVEIIAPVILVLRRNLCAAMSARTPKHIFALVKFTLTV